MQGGVAFLSCMEASAANPNCPDIFRELGDAFALLFPSSGARVSWDCGITICLSYAAVARVIIAA